MCMKCTEKPNFCVSCCLRLGSSWAFILNIKAEEQRQPLRSALKVDCGNSYSSL